MLRNDDDMVDMMISMRSITNILDVNNWKQKLTKEGDRYVLSII